MTGQQTDANVARAVQKFLDQHQPGGFRLNVQPESMRQEADWWYVTVVPDRDGVRAYDYANHLSEMEERLKDEEHLKVLLVPALVDD